MSDQQQNPANQQMEALQKQVAELQEQLRAATEDKELKKINEVVETRLNEFKKEQFEHNLENAHKVYEQATENERNAQDERDQRVWELREAKIAREKKNMATCIKQIQKLIHEGKYGRDFFNSANQDPKVQQYREFYYQLCTRVEDVDKYVDEFFERHSEETKWLD